MKPSIIAVLLGTTLLVAPLAHADAATPPIGNPYTDTFQLWASIASSIEYIAQETTGTTESVLSALQHLVSASPPSTPPAAAATSPRQTASLAEAVASFEMTSATMSTETAPVVTSDQTTNSQNVRPAELNGLQQTIPPQTALTTASSTPAFDATAYVTQPELTEQFLQFSNSLDSKINATQFLTVPGWAASQQIGQLNGTTITNANLTASEIPSLDYLSLSGGTLTGALNIPTLNASSTNYGVITSTNSSTTDATSTNLFSTFANFTTGLINTLSGTTLSYSVASTTNFSNTGTAYFGGTATTTIDSAGDLNVGGSLVANGNVILGNATTSILFSTTASSTNLFAQTASFGALSANSLSLTSAVPISSGGTGVTVPSVAGFPVEAYGAVGNGSTDDSGAIQSAINAACVAHGGKVVFAAKIYAIASQLTISCSNVFLVGQGAGGPLAAGDPSAYTDSNHYGATVLEWIGSSGGTMVDFEPSNAAANNIKGGGMDEIVLAGYGVAGTGLKLRSTNGLQFPHLTIENMTVSGVDMNITSNTLTAGNPYDTQQNYFGQVDILYDWNMPAVRNADGIVMDGGESANTSFNVFNSVYLTYENGIGVHFKNADSNTIYTLRSFQPNGYTGALVSFDASTSASGAARDNTIVYVQNNASGIVAEGNGGSGSSYHNQILSLDNGNGGAATPVVQGGASLAYATTQGSMGTTTVNGGLGINTNNTIGITKSLTINSQYQGDGIYITTTATSTGLFTDETGGGWNPLVQTGDTLLLSKGTGADASNAGGIVLAPWSNSPLGLRVTPQGSVGIGTSTPGAVLGVNGNIIGNGTLTLTGTTGTTTIASGQGFTIGNSQFVVQQSSGDIGIGTAAPASLLTDTGTAIEDSSASFVQSGGVSWSDSGQGYVAGFYNPGSAAGNRNGILVKTNATDNGSYLIRTEANGAPTFVATAAGNVGIGTTTPGANLVIQGSNANQINIANSNYDAWGIRTANNTATGNFEVFQPGVGGRLDITTSGFVGIGTTTPYSRLEVWGPDSASSTAAFNVVNTSSTTVFSVFDGGNAELSGSLSQSSDERLKTNIQSLEGSSSLALIDSLNPVTFNWIDPNQATTLQLGFIAQQVQQIFPNLVATTSATALTPGGTLSLNYIGLISPIVSAIQALSAEIASIENTIDGFAQSITSAVGNFGQVNAQNELCVGSTCVTPAQFQGMVAAASASQSSGQENNGGTDEGSSSNSATDTPPQIQINGDNPAVIQVGDTYNDLGATITGPQADLNLGITTYVNGIESSPVEIDTSAAATDTVDYVVTDQNGLTSTSTRTIIIEAPSIAPTDDASSSSEKIATTTDATTTAQ